MRHILTFSALVLVAAAGCGGDTFTGDRSSGVNGAGGTAGSSGATSATGGTSAGDGGSSSAGRGGGGASGGGGACTTDAECPRSLAPCRVCPDGTTACPWSKCESGQCHAGIDTCGAAGAGGGPGAGGASGSGGVSGECKSSAECAVPAICKVCSGGGYSCATGDCVNGKCETVYPPCSGGSGGATGAGGSGMTGGTTSSGGASGAGGSSACTSDGECASGLKCCYPCGIPGCQNTCLKPLTPGQCPLYP